MSSTWKPYFKAKAKEQQVFEQYNGLAYGYYLVRESDKARFFISKVVDKEALDQVCSAVLTDNDYLYWIDRSTGVDVNGNPALYSAAQAYGCTQQSFERGLLSYLQIYSQ